MRTNDSSFFLPLFSKVEELIRTGHGNLAARELSECQRKRKIPRAALGTFASLARRANAPLLGLQLLGPIVRPTRAAPATVDEGELAEYGACLLKIGATIEGMNLLRTLNVSKNPQVLLFMAFGLVSNWDYASSISALTKYLSSEHISDYQSATARINLAAALIFERQHEKAQLELAELLRETKANNWNLLYNNALQLSAQNALNSKQWSAVDIYLNEAEAAQLTPFDQFFIKKWRTFAEYARQRGEQRSHERLMAFRAEARNVRHWETVRDCDRIAAIVKKDSGLLTHVYFGTPFEGFRTALLTEFGATQPLPTEYDWSPDTQNTDATTRRITLDVLRARSIDGTLQIKAGQSVHKLLVALCRDFYRPASVAAIHHHLYPTEYFNPRSSPTRVHQVLLRLRRWIKNNEIPLVVHEENAAYSMKSAGNIHLRVPKCGLSMDRPNVLLLAIKENLGQSIFSVEQAGRVLKVSIPTALRLVNSGQQMGNIERVGNGPFSRYRFVG